jgi:hypothetical protein
MFEVDEIQAQVGKMRGFASESDQAFQREVNIRNIVREKGLENKPQTPDRTPQQMLKSRRDENFIGAHSHGKVTFGRARPE